MMKPTNMWISAEKGWVFAAGFKFFLIGNNPLTTYYLNRILGIPDSVSSISRNEKTIKMLGGLANWRLAVDDFTEFPVGRLLLFDKKMGTHSGR